MRSGIDAALAQCLQQLRRRFAADGAGELADELIRATLPKGGRTRPILCCLGYAAVGGQGGPSDPRILRAAASIELLHSFALAHDDVMDGSPTRRGEPSIHRRFADQRRAAGGKDAELHGVSLAILVGDLALVASDLLFAGCGFAPDLVAGAYGPLSEMRMDAVAGQFLDLTHSGTAVPDPELPRRIARLKTGSYSVQGPLLVGATLGGGGEGAKQSLRAYATPLGEAFQLADDLLGLFGDPALTGKDSENDLRKGKPTPLIARALATAPPAGRELIRSTWGNPQATAADLLALRKAVRDSGAAEFITARVEDLVSGAIAALEGREGRHLAAGPRTGLQDLARQIGARAKV